MMQDRLEDTLRSLPTAKPPESVRAHILHSASNARWAGVYLSRTESRGSCSLKRSLAFALVLLALLALDFGLEQAQSARLSHLIGDGRQRMIAPIPEKSMLLALAQQKALLTDLLGKAHE